MRLTQGTFSFLPDLTDDQIRAQVEYCLSQGWALSIEYTDLLFPGARRQALGVRQLAAT